MYMLACVSVCVCVMLSWSSLPLNLFTFLQIKFLVLGSMKVDF